ncbi:hypothetical protein D3C73_1445350 [compost metagenome]
MIHKAAGQLSNYLSRLSPWDLIDVWIAGINQGDRQLIEATTAAGIVPTPPYTNMRRLSEFDNQHITSALYMDIPVDVWVTSPGSNKSVQRHFLIHLERSSPIERWLITRVL